MDGTVLRANCPKCQAVLRIPTKWLGQPVKCKNCGATVRTKARTGAQPSAKANAAPAAPSAPPAPNLEPLPADNDDLFDLPRPVPAPVPLAQRALDANGQPLPAPVYPHAPPVPVPATPYPVPVGYSHPGAPIPVPAVAVPAAPSASPFEFDEPPAEPHTAPQSANGKPAAVAKATAADRRGKPVGAAPLVSPSAGRYRQKPKSSNKLIWIGLCLFLTAGLVAGGVFGAKFLSENAGKPDEAEGPPVAKGGQRPGVTPTPKPVNYGFPRRMLFVSITKYMYLNPLTQGQPGATDRTAAAAKGLAFSWRVPTEPNNNQLFVLSDTVVGPEERLPLKNVLKGAFEEFFNTSRAQDRIAVYFGGHAIEKDGKAYIAPMEGEADGEGWEQSLIPLDEFYAALAKSPAAQKVVIWDVCRFNPEKGRARPGSEPMSEALFAALSSPPAGVQAVLSCKAGENAMEFNALVEDAEVYSGSSFLESARFVADSRNNRLPKAVPTAADPIPVGEWGGAVKKRVEEMSDLAAKAGSPGKQTTTIIGEPPASLPEPDGAEKAAARFEFPQPPKGASPAEINAVANEFQLPPLKPNLAGVALADFPFPADAMKDFTSDGVTVAEIAKDREKYPFRAKVLDALNLIKKNWSDGAGTMKLRTAVKGPLDEKTKAEVKKEQDFWAIGINDLETQLGRLKDAGDMREGQPKRWQAHYDFALASLMARLAYMNEYNKLLGNLLTETLPALDPKLGHDGYILVASENLKSGREIKKMAEEAHELFAEIATKYKGTPWAIQAKQEKSVEIGLAWKPASLKK